MMKKRQKNKDKISKYQCFRGFCLCPFFFYLSFCSTLIIFCLLISYGNHGERIKDHKEQMPFQKNIGSSGIVFTNDLHNFGTLKAGEIVSFSFVFINNGRTPVSIKKAESSCGCLKVNYDKEETGPGKKSAVEVIFNTSGEWGNALKMIAIETSSGEKKELRISAYIENENFNNLLKSQQ
jgi:hypothetical protein